MKHWVIPHGLHVAQRNHWLVSPEWTFFNDYSDFALEMGDVAYIFGGNDGLFAWGYLSDVSNRTLLVKVIRGAAEVSLISQEVFGKNEILTPLLRSRSVALLLMRIQARTINDLLPPNLPKPPVRLDYFVDGENVDEQEGIYTEYKDISVKKIPDVAYDNAVPFSRQNGGRLYFGISDQQVVIGVNMSVSQADELKRKIEDKLAQIDPPMRPFEDYLIDLHRVFAVMGFPTSDRYVVQVEYKENKSKEYKTAGGKTSIRGYSGNRSTS